MTRRLVPLAHRSTGSRWLGLGVAWLALGCGPMIELETNAGGSSNTGPPPPPMTSTSTTTAGPGPTTVPPPADSGVLDTAEPWLDLPEECSAFTQDCPPGYKCVPGSEDGSLYETRCVPVVDDPQGPGEACTYVGAPYTGADDCDATSICWDVDIETQVGVCVALCLEIDQVHQCPDACKDCVINNAPFGLCMPTCDPLTQSCPDGQACYPVLEVFQCAPDSSEPGTGIGSPCEFLNVCPPGMACIDGAFVPGCETANCCAPYCPFGGADPCPGLMPGSSCQAWYEDGQVPNPRCLVTTPGICGVPP